MISGGEITAARTLAIRGPTGRRGPSSRIRTVTDASRKSLPTTIPACENAGNQQSGVSARRSFFPTKLTSLSIVLPPGGSPCTVSLVDEDERDPAAIAAGIDAARDRLIAFTDTCREHQWRSAPLDGDP